MKGHSLHGYGEPADVLSVTDQPVPEPGAGEVRVKSRISPVNRAPALRARSLLRGHGATSPSGAVFESVSTIDKLGPGCRGARRRPARVPHTTPTAGATGHEYAAVRAMVAWPVPDDLPDEQIACMINPATAILMVRHVLACRVGSGCCSPPRLGTGSAWIIRLSQHDRIRLVRRREAVRGPEGAWRRRGDRVRRRPINEQVRKIVGRGRGLRDLIRSLAGPAAIEDSQQCALRLADQQRPSPSRRPAVHAMRPAHAGAVCGWVARCYGWVRPLLPARPPRRLNQIDCAADPPIWRWHQDYEVRLERQFTPRSRQGGIRSATGGEVGGRARP